MSFIDILFILICIIVLIICYKLMYSPIVFINKENHKKMFLILIALSTVLAIGFSLLGFLMDKIRFHNDFIVTELGEEISNSYVYIMLANTGSMENIDLIASNSLFTVYGADWIFEKSTSLFLIAVLLILALIYNFRMAKIVSDYSFFKNTLEKYKNLRRDEYTHHSYFNANEKNIINYSFKTNFILLGIIINIILLILSVFDFFKLIVHLPYFVMLFGKMENVEHSFNLSFLHLGISNIASYILLLSAIIIVIILISEITPYYKLIMNRDSFSYKLLSVFKSIFGCLGYILFFLILFICYAIIPIIVMLLDGGGDSGRYYDDYHHPGYHYVDDYYRSDGTHVRGHWKTNPDEYRWNNLND